jgi:hypothetical protein
VAAVIMMMMVMMLLLLHNHLKKLCLKVVIALKGIKDLFSSDLVKRCCYDSCLLVVLSDELNCCLDLLLVSLVASCKDNCSSVLDLVDEELTKVLDINLGLSCINNSNSAVKLHVVIAISDILDGSHNI